MKDLPGQFLAVVVSRWNNREFSPDVVQSSPAPEER
jgi:hypothetical protein